MLLNFFWMGLSSAVRLSANLVLFILIARALGPEEFGHYMFWYGTTYLCSLISNYGLGTMLLKEIAQHPNDVTNALSDALGLRLMLSVALFLCVLGSSIIVDRPELLLILFLSHVAESISEIFYVTYRALGHYSSESKLAACVSVVQLILITLSVITNQNTEGIALAYLAGKIAQLVLVLPVSRRVFGNFSLSSPRMILKLAARTKAFAADTLLGCAFGHIDNIVLRLFAGIDSVGIYQSGMRIFQGGAQAAPILANVFLPEMARKALEKNRDFRIAFIAQAAFVSYGIIFGLSLAYFPNQIVNLTFGKNYERLATLLPLFGFLFFIRFFASAWGVILIAEGFQEYRAKATAIHLVFVLILGSYLALSMQTKGWLVASILANLLLGVLLMLRVTRRGSRKSIMIGVCMLVLGGLLFVPILF